MAFYGTNSITAGAHRLWTHKSYKVCLMLTDSNVLHNSRPISGFDCFTWSGIQLRSRFVSMGHFLIPTKKGFQNDVIEWARDHRCHHKWSDSDGDPHNIKRGFFFAHMGWLMVKKHPKVIEYVYNALSVQNEREWHNSSKCSNRAEIIYWYCKVWNAIRLFQVKEMGAKIDMSDLEADPILAFQRKWAEKNSEFNAHKRRKA